MLERHNPPQPDFCEVCRNALASGLDVENEHALVRLATQLMLGDLDELDGGPARFSSVAVSSFPPVDRGPRHYFEPRHWFWALYFEPAVGVVLRKEIQR
jgi:hypothetical protein